MVYDFIVLGGGISGLYCTYLLLKRFPKKSILLLEKESDVGGRVHTYSDKYMTVEAGAGRFNKKHTILINLLRELGLTQKIVSISSEIGYAPADGNEPKILTGNAVLSRGYITKVVKASKGEPLSVLQNISFLDYAKKILPKSEVEYITDSFGYYSELVIMNAHDAINLMGELGPENEFLGLRGGLFQIIDKLETKIEKYAGSRIMCNKTVIDIQVINTRDTGNGKSNNTIEVYCKENKRPYVCNQCICALPKQVAENLRIFKPLKPFFSTILCAPLCRIYSVFPVINGKVWFSGLPKFTTKNNMRMVIPISEERGVIMISYSDNKYADGWNKLYNTKGVDAVDRELAKLIKESIGIDIPKPLTTQVFHWPCGVGYWGIGADSSHFPLQPLQSIGNTASGKVHTIPVDRRLQNANDSSSSMIPIYLSGEHYSEKSQQWMEGALETANRVVLHLLKFKTSSL